MSVAVRDVLAFLVGSAGVLADFFGALDVAHGAVLLGAVLLLAGVAALWGAFRIASPPP